MTNKTPILDSIRTGGHRGPCKGAKRCPGMRAALAANGKTGIEAGLSLTKSLDVALVYRLSRTEIMAINHCPWCGAKVSR